MANRRMFSKAIINSARFIKMPSSSQLLYFHLGLNADDDGVVEAFMVMRMIGASEDDLKILVAKGFITILNEDLVAFINDWLEHNIVRADRKIDSKYKDLIVKFIPNDNQMTTKWQPNGNQMAAQVRLGKDKLGKDNKTILTHKKNSSGDYSEDFEHFWSLYPPRAGSNGKHSAWKAWIARVNEGIDPQDIINGVMRYQVYCKNTGKINTEFVKQASTFLNKDRQWQNNWSAPNEQRQTKSNSYSERGARGAELIQKLYEAARSEEFNNPNNRDNENVYDMLGKEMDK
jgi:hypothetical protein